MTGRNGASSAPKTLLQQTACYSGKKKDHTVKNVLLVNAPLTILFLSDTYGGRIHDKRIADATPYPLPAGSRLLQDLRVEPQVTRTAPPQTRTSAINTSGSSVSRFRCIDGVHDPGRRESVPL